MHPTSSRSTPEAVRAWRLGWAGERGAAAVTTPAPTGDPRGVGVAPPRRWGGCGVGGASGCGRGEPTQRRGSAGRFGHAALTSEELATGLWAATRGSEADVPAGLVDLYLIVNAVDDVPAGAYVYRPAPHALELLAAGNLRNRSAYLCLEQPLGGAAAAVIYFLAVFGAPRAAADE